MRGTCAVILLENLAHNLSEIRRAAGSKVKICLPVKADAYGHGAAASAKKALECGVSFLAVATVDEGIALRKAGIDAPILLFSIPSKSEIEELVCARLTPFVSEKGFILELEKAAASILSEGRRADLAQKRNRLPLHIKIETGMQRTGCAPSEASELAALIEQCPHLFLEGTATHLAAADSADEDDAEFTKRQILLFRQAIDSIRAGGFNPGIIHAAGSAGAIAYPEARFDMIRPGIAVYGYAPSKELKSALNLKPVMELRTEVSFVKTIPAGASVSYGREWKAPFECAIATLPIGYADGIRRSLSPGLSVEILGEPCPVRGRICMDQLMAELPRGIAKAVVSGTPAKLFGPSPCLFSAEDIASLAGTIPYEITCGISARVPRIFVE